MTMYQQMTLKDMLGIIVDINKLY